jgi:SIT4-associating protein SAP185/190
LQNQDLIPLLLGYLDNKYPPATQTSAGDFIKAIITISANASQNEQSCIGPNNLTRQLVSDKCIETLVQDMLHGGNPLTVIVGTIIEVIRKNNSDYDPDVGAGPDSAPSGNDPIYLGTLLRTFAKHVPDFMRLILSPTHTVLQGDKNIMVPRKELPVAFGRKIEPLGFDRFKTCELMAELLHCSNMGLLNERGSEAFVRQRDAERDRLKAEGYWTATRPPTSAATEFSEDSTGYGNGVSPLTLGGPGAAEEARKLEIANNADDDGFEDVGNSADLVDDIKDDFDEKSSFECDVKPEDCLILPKPLKPRLDLDEDFVDEPLTSPRVEALDERDEELMEDLDPPESLEAGPLSPTLCLSSQVQGLELEKDEPTGKGTLLGSPVERDDEPHNFEPTTEDRPSEAPPLPPRERSLEPDQKPDLSSVEVVHPDPYGPPQPLFAARHDRPAQSGFVSQPEDQDANGGNSHDTIDATLGGDGDSVRSVSMSGNDQSFMPEVENDVDGQPVVGDFLKMMFVEHKVVPTILVSHLLVEQGTVLNHACY